jgi:hypothetical protein
MNNSANLPSRVRDNWVKNDQEKSYTRYLSYPTSTAGVRSNIEAAFGDRTAKGDLVKNSRALSGANTCP